MNPEFNVNLRGSEGSHLCIQENRGEEIWIYCPICEEYVRKVDKNLKLHKLKDTEYLHHMSFSFNLPNMN